MKTVAFAFSLYFFSSIGSAQQLGPRQVDALPSSTPTLIEHYGTDPAQYGELRLPEGKGPFPLAIVIHGGCWTKGFATLKNTAPISSSLAEQGLATWNIEYRQTGDKGGGWPGTFNDWAKAADHVRELGKRYPIDLSRISTIGHSAGAEAAVWIASRQRLPKASEFASHNAVEISNVFAIDGPVDLAAFVGRDADICGKPVVAPFMGGTPSELPSRYLEASAGQRLPLGIPQFLISASVLTYTEADLYAKQANTSGDKVQVLVIDTGHFNVIAPNQQEWQSVKGIILQNSMASPKVQK